MAAKLLRFKQEDRKKILAVYSLATPPDFKAFGEAAPSLLLLQRAQSSHLLSSRGLRGEQMTLIS